MCNTEVVNIKHDDYDVYIGRGSKYGNPFKIGPDGTREEVIVKFERYFWDNFDYGHEDTVGRKFSEQDLCHLAGKRLGCYCFPNKCHGDVLSKIVEEYVATPKRNLFEEISQGFKELEGERVDKT